MIFYFSGTGNSRWVAEQLSQHFGESLVAISHAISMSEYEYTLADGEMLGFVFPTYSWGPAPIVVDFVKRLKLEGFSARTFCYMVTTCGDDVGLAVDVWRNALGEKHCNAAYSVQMPNNYILLPGFDVDNQLLEEEKKCKAVKRVDEIVNNIKHRIDVVDVTKGGFAWLKTRVIYPLFSRYYMNGNKFHACDEKCNHCGMCVKNCPTQNISMKLGEKPKWHGKCAMCLACIHRCPMRAIEYGNTTQKKGRYFFKQS